MPVHVVQDSATMVDVAVKVAGRIFLAEVGLVARMTLANPQKAGIDGREEVATVDSTAAVLEENSTAEVVAVRTFVGACAAAVAHLEFVAHPIAAAAEVVALSLGLDAAVPPVAM